MWRPLALLSGGLALERCKDWVKKPRGAAYGDVKGGARRCVACEYQSTLQGICPQSGVRYWVARRSDSTGRAGVLEKSHCFAVAHGGGSAGAAAAQLPRLAAESFQQRVTEVPLWSRPGEDAEAETWAEALSVAFAHGDQQLCSAAAPLCSAVLTVVTRSGLYVASCGLCRAVLGTEVVDHSGVTVFCDEASVPHDASNDQELKRLAGASKPPKSLQWRGLGGKNIKAQHPGIIAMPDVVRIQHGAQRRLVLLGSQGLWHLGPRLPMERAWEALRAGECPALAAAKGCEDAVVLVLLIPAGVETLRDEAALLP